MNQNEKAGNHCEIKKGSSPEGFSIEAQGSEIDKGVLEIEVTLPASLVIDNDLEMVLAQVNNVGISEVVHNEDGTITYKMYNTSGIMSHLDIPQFHSIEEIKNGEEYISVRDITFNQSLSEFTIVVDKEMYVKSIDRFVVFGLGIAGIFIGVLNGVETDQNKVTIFIKDEKTQKVFEKIVYPDDFGME